LPLPNFSNLAVSVVGSPAASYSIVAEAILPLPHPRIVLLALFDQATLSLQRARIAR
jgi:hypothetical protein